MFTHYFLFKNCQRTQLAHYFIIQTLPEYTAYSLLYYSNSARVNSLLITSLFKHCQRLELTHYFIIQTLPEVRAYLLVYCSNIARGQSLLITFLLKHCQRLELIHQFLVQRVLEIRLELTHYFIIKTLPEVRVYSLLSYLNIARGQSLLISLLLKHCQSERFLFVYD